MKLTLKKLDSLCEKPCIEGRNWFINQKESDLEKICYALLDQAHSSWVEWLLARVLNKKQRIEWAIYAAELVIDIFEKKYPDDKRSRDAIKAAKKYLKSPNKKNKDAAYAAAYAAANAADAAANAADAAANAADAAAYAAYAAYAANAAAYAAYAAANVANAAANAAYAAAYAAARKELQIKLIKKAMQILRRGKK